MLRPPRAPRLSRFWDVATGEQLPSGATDLRDADWATWTAPLGWPVQGIWPPFADGTDINAVARSRSGALLATGDDSGMVKLFNYPCPHPRFTFTEFGGHAAHVTNVRWCRDDAILVSVGGRDRAVLQWRPRLDEDPAPPPVSEEELAAEARDMGRSEGGGSRSGSGSGDVELLSLAQAAPPRRPPVERDLEHALVLHKDAGGAVAGGGPSGMAVRPWVGAIKEPVVVPRMDTSAPADDVEVR